MNEDKIIKLSELLSHSTQDEQWNQEACELIEQIHTDEKSDNKQWQTYCEENKEQLRQVTKRVHSLEALERWVVLGPFIHLSLDLSHQGIGAKACSALASSALLTHVQTLDLSENPIGPKGCQALADSPHLAQLHTLLLNNTKADFEGTFAISYAPHLTKLQHLSLDQNRIESGGCSVLFVTKTLTNLRTLSLRKNIIGPEACVGFPPIFGQRSGKVKVNSSVVC